MRMDFCSRKFRWAMACWTYERVTPSLPKARPDTRMSMEMITRNPLPVPCLTEKYWKTFPDRGGEFGANAGMVRSRENQRKLPSLAGLDRAAQLRLEDDNVRRCLQYAGIE